MANGLAQTVLVEGIATAGSKLTEFENRLPTRGLIDTFREGGNQLISNQDIQRLTTSLRRPVSIPILRRSTNTIRNIRQVDPTPDHALSAKATFSWFDIAFSFEITPTGNEDNYITEAQEFAFKLKEEIMAAILRDNTNGLEAKMISYLNANKWATPPASGIPGVNVQNGAYEMKGSEYLIKAPVIMEELEMGGQQLIDVGNIASLARRREEKTYGYANQQNIAQYLDEIKYFKSARIAVPDGYDESHFLMPAGSVAMVDWVENDARAGREAFDGKYTQVQDPYFGIRWGVFTKATRSDRSADLGRGTERVVSLRYDFATSIGLISSYSSVAGESPIVKINVVPES